MNRQEQPTERVNRGAVWAITRLLGALSYFFAIVVYTLALGLMTFWLFSAMNVESPVAVPVSEADPTGVVPPRPTVFRETLSILIGFSALLGTAAALLWVPIMIARSSSRATHRISSWLSPDCTALRLLVVKAGLYSVPLFVLLGATLSYYTSLNVALLLSGLAAWVAALLCAVAQTIISKRMQYDAKEIF